MKKAKGLKNWQMLLISVLIPFSAAFIGSIFTSSSVAGWYSLLNKPFFSPPNWIFGPVWTVLYLLMGISLYLVWSKKAKNKKNAVIAFGIQLFLNALWSFVFFGLHMPLLAFAEILVLLAAIAATAALFYRISRPAGLLFIPYILWVLFASALNLSIHILN